MIVVTGANGNLGRQVVNLLKDRIPVSEIAESVREPEKAADLSAAGIDVRRILETVRQWYVRLLEQIKFLLFQQAVPLTRYLSTVMRWRQQ